MIVSFLESAPTKMMERGWSDLGRAKKRKGRQPYTHCTTYHNSPVFSTGRWWSSQTLWQKKRFFVPKSFRNHLEIIQKSFKNDCHKIMTCDKKNIVHWFKKCVWHLNPKSFNSFFFFSWKTEKIWSDWSKKK